MAYEIEHNGKTYMVIGKFGEFSVYCAGFCLAFDIMTKNDAENWIWANAGAAQ